MSARNLDDLPGKHAGLFAGEEEDGLGDVLGLDEPVHGDDGEDGLFEFLVYPSGLGGPRCHAVHGDAVGGHFEGDATGECLEGGLAGSVGYLSGKDLRRVGREVDYTAVVAPVVDELAGHQQASAHVHGKGVVDDGGGNLLDGVEAVAVAVGRVVHEDVHASVAFEYGGVDGLHGLFLGDVALEDEVVGIHLA